MTHSDAAALGASGGAHGLGRLWRRASSLGLAALGVRVLAAGLAYVAQVLLARWLGPAEYGVLAFTQTLVAIAALLACLGFGHAVIRFLALYHEQGDGGLARGFLLYSGAVTLAGAAGAGVVLWAIAPLLANGPLACGCLWLAVAALPAFALGDLVEGVARSQGWTVRALAPPYVFRQAAFLGGVALAGGAGFAFDARLGMQAFTVATYAAAAGAFLLVVPSALGLFAKASPRFATKTWSKAAAPLFLTDLSQLAQQYLDVVVVGVLTSPAEAGVYFAASRIAGLLGFIQFAVGAAFGHRFARAAHEGPGALEALYSRLARNVAAIGAAAALVLAALAPPLLSLFGPGFDEARAIAPILIGAAALRLAAGPAEEALAMTDRAPLVWRANMAGAVTAAGLAVALTPHWRGLGAAWAMAAGAAFGAALLLAFASTAIRQPARAGAPHDAEEHGSRQ
jgi:O-antigen/teichoic acid export membrane protein